MVHGRAGATAVTVIDFSLPRVNSPDFQYSAWAMLSFLTVRLRLGRRWHLQTNCALIYRRSPGNTNRFA
jgi:hypothetical protein